VKFDGLGLLVNCYGSAGNDGNKENAQKVEFDGNVRGIHAIYNEGNILRRGLVARVFFLYSRG